MNITRNGSQPSGKGPSEYFTGNVRVDSPFQRTAPARVSGAVVTFEPGARTAWHTHPLGQTLIVTSGRGRVQRVGGAIEDIAPGDVVWIEPGEKHWHGASPTTAMTHVAIAEMLDGAAVHWMEHVTDDQYGDDRRGHRNEGVKMRATVMYGAHDVRVETVPDARLIEPTDALVRVTRACICGSDLWPYNSMAPTETGNRMGHEFVGIVDAVGSAVRTVKKGDLVVAPFAWSDGTCEFCQQGLQTSCLHGGWWGGVTLDGGQGEAVRIPQADGTLVVLPVGPDHALMPSLLTLSDVMGTGHHAALAAKVRPGRVVAVVGDGAVGLCGVIAARRLGAEQIIMLGRHGARTSLARTFGATDIVSERGDAAIERVRELTGGLGAHSVLECVGHGEAMRTAVGIARAGGTVGRVGVPQETTIPDAQPTFYANITIAGGPAPVRAYIEELMPDVLEGRIQPGRVFDCVTNIDGVPDGYQAMNSRDAIKVMIEF